MSEPPATQQSTIEVRWLRPDTALVLLGGEHDLGSESELTRSLDHIVRSCSHLIVDLSACEFVDSTTIGALLRAKRLAETDRVEFNVVLGRASIAARVVEISRVGPSLNVVPTVELALAAAAR